MNLLLLSAIRNQILHNLPVHQRLTAEKVHLKIPSVAGIGNQKIQSLLSHLKAHQLPATVILALLRKTVATGKITVMGNM